MGASKPVVPATIEYREHHFADAVAIREAIVGADLHGTREAGTRLVERIPPPLDILDQWIPYVADLRNGAIRLANVKSLEDAAVAMGSLAYDCGQCHEDLVASPSFGDPEPLAETVGGVHGRMQKYRWAVGRMWEGVVVGSNESWNRGASALRDEPLGLGEIASDGPINPELANLNVAVGVLGRRAMVERDKLGRADLFGELLGTCATCHRLTNAPVLRRRIP